MKIKKLRLYLDNCCYNRPFDEQDQAKIRLETEAKLHIQSLIREKVYSLVWSYVLDSENDDNPYEEKRQAIALWRRIADEYCASSEEILLSGEKIMTIGIRAKDALHIACALYCGCDYFITTDQRLVVNKAVEKIRIVNPVTFVIEMEGLK